MEARKAKKWSVVVPARDITHSILLIRGQKVILDSDLANLYDVEIRVLNQAVKRNIARFPADFMFQLTAEEITDVESQSSGPDLRSQFVTLKTGRGQHRK